MEKYKIIDYISIIALLVSVISPVIFYSQLPDQVPIHFNAKGKVDSYSEKSTLWIIPLVGIILCYGLFQLEKYLKSVNDKNLNKDTIAAQKVSKILLLLISLSFAYITIQVILTAFKKSNGIGSWFIFVFMFSMIFLPMIPLINTKIKS